MHECENAKWLPMENVDLLDINGGSLLDTIAGVGCLVLGGAAVVGAGAVLVCGAVTHTLPAVAPAAGKLALAGVASATAGAKILGY